MWAHNAMFALALDAFHGGGATGTSLPSTCHTNLLASSLIAATVIRCLALLRAVASPDEAGLPSGGPALSTSVPDSPPCGLERGQKNESVGWLLVVASERGTNFKNEREQGVQQYVGQYMDQRSSPPMNPRTGLGAALPTCVLIGSS